MRSPSTAVLPKDTQAPTVLAFSVTSVGTRQGENAITVVAIDEAGNRSTAGTTTILIGF